MEIAEDCVGGAAFDKYGSPLADMTLARAKESDAVLLRCRRRAEMGPRMPMIKGPEQGAAVAAQDPRPIR